MKKNWLTTLGGIMAGCGTLPMIISQSGYHVPNWLGLTLVLLGGLGLVVMGVAAKGQDEHSTAQEVHTATVVAQVEETIKAAVDASKIKDSQEIK